MAAYRQETPQFLLKDLLFNEVKVNMLAEEIAAVYPRFATKAFVSAVVSAFPEQELMERIGGIVDQLAVHLPTDYEEALAIIIKALPEPLDNSKSDDDFGDFIYAPYSYFVARYGCTKEHHKISLVALSEITKRFSAEASLRAFLNTFPAATQKFVYKWAHSPDYHVRRLSSEGTRPNLPWAKKINLEPGTFIPILDILHADATRYVTRSVANHLNDISKTNSTLVYEVLEKWQKEKRQTESELNFISRHALRTLVKRGDKNALRLLGYQESKFHLDSFTLSSRNVEIGDSLSFMVKLRSCDEKEQKLRIDYVIYFKKANGSLASKVFALGERILKPGEVVVIEKRHPLRLMSTRTLYPGEQKIEIRVNGEKVATDKFEIL